ncbi:MAG: regulatory protein RecX [Frankia sp.]
MEGEYRQRAAGRRPARPRRDDAAASAYGGRLRGDAGFGPDQGGEQFSRVPDPLNLDAPAPGSRASNGRDGRRSVQSDAGAGRAGRSSTPSDPVGAAREACLRLLTVRPRSRAELATALTRRGYSAEVVETVLGRLTEVGLVDDAAFAEAFVFSRQGSRSLARTALSHRLRQRGVDREIIDEAVSVITTEDELASARDVAERKLASTRGLPAPVRARRIASTLARRGYPAAVAARVVREALGLDEEIEFQEGDPIEFE